MPDGSETVSETARGHLTARCHERLALVHPDLRAVIELASVRCARRFLVLETLRSPARQRELYAKGRTKPGKKVTWSMDSRHLAGPDGLARATDLAPLQADNTIDWNDRDGFLAVGKAMFVAALELGVPIRWGWDWDGDGKLQERGEYDGPHFELPRSTRHP